MPPTKHVDTPTTIGVSMSGKIHDAADSSGNERAHAERTMAPPASLNPIADVCGRTKDPNYHDQALVLTTVAARGRTKDPCSAPTLLNERQKWKSPIATKHYYLILDIIRDYKSSSGIFFFFNTTLTKHIRADYKTSILNRFLHYILQ
jgi:hypothetical protein